MKNFAKPLTWIALMFLIVSLSSNTFTAKETVIYIVRHAEKDASDPANKNPDLSGEGKERATELNELLRKEKIAAVFSTNYKRTMQTVTAVAQRNGIPVKSYDPMDAEDLAGQVKSEFANQKVLIAGHSNTILEMVRAFGATPPFEQLNDDDYDLIFTVTIDKENKVLVKTERYGKKHHSSPIPAVSTAP